MRDSPELFQLMDEFKSKVCGNKRLNCRSCITYSLDHILAHENCNTSSSQSRVEIIICTSQGFLVIIPFFPRDSSIVKGWSVKSPWKILHVEETKTKKRSKRDNSNNKIEMNKNL